MAQKFAALNLSAPAADMLFMNQRREPRFEANQPVWITLFGEPDIRLTACIKNVSVRGIGLELQGPVAIGTALKFEVDDSLILGEVIYCRQVEASCDDGSFYVGVELEQALRPSAGRPRERTPPPALAAAPSTG